MKKITQLTLVLLSVFLVQCAKERSEPESPIGLEVQTEDLVQGSVTLANTDISYSSRAIGELLFLVKIQVDNSLLEAKIFYDKENIEFNGHDNHLTEDQKEMMLVLGNEFSQHILKTKGADINMTEFAFISILEYFAKSPTDYVYGKRSVITDKADASMLRSRDEGVTCIRRNTFVNAEYDDANGNHSDNVEVGYYARSGYGCMGRCGADCGRWWIPSAWTKDCLDHDQCSHLNNSSGGASDSNCGDEFNEAADDWIFGVWRGCRG